MTSEFEDARTLVGVPDAFSRMWTPHRMAYISGDARPQDESVSQCPFCAAPDKSDEDALIVHRGRTCYVIMNLFPYNSGHLLVCPYEHMPLYTDLSPQARAEFGELTAAAMRVLQASASPHGFNLGMNQGAVAGAGVAGHLHQHIIPRWSGDTNFFPLVAGVKAIPEMLSDARRRLAKAWGDAG
ncbi:MAG: HIT domain-containing protein [Actinomycetaceae bacterium]|nr:HIT domain-containing protein [Actinomycetaceae bacterium]